MKFLYYFEHKFLPELFYMDPTRCIMQFTATKVTPNFIYHDSASRAGLPVLGNFESHGISALDESKQVLVYMLECPFPEGGSFAALAKFIFLLVNPTKNIGAYITLEPDRAGAFLCGWTKKGVHTNFGVLNNENDLDKQLKLCYEALVTEQENL